MLSQKTPALNDIVSFRLSSGEEIVGKLVAEDTTTVTIAKPISIGIQMVGKGQASIAFMPFLASVDDSGSVTFYRSNLIMVPTKTRDDVRASYVQATSGLAIPTSGEASGLIKGF